MKLKKVYILVLLFLLVVPVLASAQLRNPDPVGNLPDLTGSQGLAGFLSWIIGKILVFAGVIAVLFVIIGGYQYIFSGANEELAETGKKTLQNAIIGLIIIILSYTLVTVIFRALGGYSV